MTPSIGHVSQSDGLALVAFGRGRELGLKARGTGIRQALAVDVSAAGDSEGRRAGTYATRMIDPLLTPSGFPDPARAVASAAVRNG